MTRSRKGQSEKLKEMVRQERLIKEKESEDEDSYLLPFSDDVSDSDRSSDNNFGVGTSTSESSESNSDSLSSETFTSDSSNTSASGFGEDAVSDEELMPDELPEDTGSPQPLKKKRRWPKKKKSGEDQGVKRMMEERRKSRERAPPPIRRPSLLIDPFKEFEPPPIFTRHYPRGQPQLYRADEQRICINIVVLSEHLVHHLMKTLRMRDIYPIAGRGSFAEDSFDDEIVCTSPDKSCSMRYKPSYGLITGFKVGNWEVLYRPLTTKNMMRAGLPTMMPNFSSLKDKQLIETNTQLPHHGFARLSDWKLVEKSETHCVMDLCDSAETLEMYPFKFRFAIKVSVENNGTLRHETIMENRETDKVMPVQPGIHPYFTCPRELLPKIQTDNISGFDAKDWKWVTKTDTPDNNYPFEKSASFTIPTLGTVTFEEEPQQDQYHYRRMQIWTEPADGLDHDFICLEPVSWHANGMNSKDTRINVPPQQTVSMVIRLKCKPE